MSKTRQQMWSAREYLSLISCLVPLFCAANAWAASSVTAEKNCLVRVEGDEFAVGDKVLVFREQDGKKQKLAILSIQRKLDGAKAIGKVVNKGKSVTCPTLKGASAELFKSDKDSASGGPGNAGAASSRASDTAKRGAPALSGSLNPGQRGEVASQLIAVLMSQQGGSSLHGIGMGLDADVYPFLFFSQGSWQGSIGLGFSFDYVAITPDSQAPATQTSGEQVAGKVSTSIQDLEADLIYRISYLENMMTTEIRPSFLSRTVKQSFKGNADILDGGLPPALSSTGLGFGLTQRMLFKDILRVNGWFSMGFGLSSKAQSGKDGSALTAGTASLFQGGLSADYLYRAFKFSGGLKYVSHTVAIKGEREDVKQSYSPLVFFGSFGYRF